MPMPGGAPRSVSSMAFDDGPVPPPTPQIQYYHSSSREPRKTSSSSYHAKSSSNAGISNDTLMKARASLLSGGLGGPSSVESSHMADGMSPISPAAMIGRAEHEPLMLPPSPDKKYAFPLQARSNIYNDVHMANPSHLEWLQQINAMAKASIYNPALPPMQPPMPTTHSNMPPTILTNPAVPPMAAHAIQQFSNGVAIPPHRAGDMLYTHLAQLQKAPPTSEAESEEKRTRRLERNRESARKSRRRKKERLTHLGGKVAALHTKLSAERQKDINLMNAGLQNDNTKMLAELKADDGDLEEKIYKWMQSTGPNCEVRRAVVDFQYSTLEQTLLSRHEKFLLWLTLHREDYFTKAKELHSKREGNQVSILFFFFSRVRSMPEEYRRLSNLFATRVFSVAYTHLFWKD
jgi:hypothetical protein